MKLINSTHWSDAFLRRMVRWCAKQVGIRLADVRQAKFTKTYMAYKGRACGRTILVRIGPPERYPIPESVRQGVTHPSHADQTEALVSTTAHELTHVWQYYVRKPRPQMRERLEPQCIWTEGKVLTVFRKQRDELLAAWAAERLAVAAEAPARPSVVEQRAAKADADLSRWQRKLKLAATKVKKLKRRVAYYQRQAR